jgi:hypothetical protein
MKAALLFLSCVALANQTLPPRDKPATAAAPTAVVRGRITSAVSGEPLHRVRVTLNGSTQPPPSAVTDTGGEFEITSVAPGTYTASATRAGYLTTQYGQSRLREAGRALEVVSGAVVDRVNMALVRGGVLAGIITDDTGSEYPGVRVEALEFRYIRGRRILVQAASTIANDLGQFRLSGLPPGPYFLRASTTDTWADDQGVNTYTYVTTYYPGVTGSNEAESVSLAASQEIAQLNFGLRPGRTARITGILQNAAGESMGAQAINLDRATRGVGGALFSLGNGGSTRTDPGGAFEFRDLAPGEYVVYSGSDAESARVTVILADGDARAVALRPRKPTAMTGTIVTDTGEPPPFPPRSLRITPIAADPESVLPSFTAPGAVEVSRDWTFRFPNISGQHLFRVTGLPDDWMLSGIVLNRRDLTDSPLSVLSDGVLSDGVLSDGAAVTGVQIVISGKAAKLTGQVRDAEGTPMPDSTVLVFAAEPARWTPASRFIRVARPNAEGRFSVAGLVPAAYRAVALAFVADGQWEDPSFLRSLASATTFEARASETATLNLRVERPR